MHTLELTQRPPISRRTPSLSLFTVSDFADKEEALYQNRPTKQYLRKNTMYNIGHKEKGSK